MYTPCLAQTHSLEFIFIRVKSVNVLGSSKVKRIPGDPCATCTGGDLRLGPVRSPSGPESRKSCEECFPSDGLGSDTCTPSSYVWHSPCPGTSDPDDKGYNRTLPVYPSDKTFTTSRTRVLRKVPVSDLVGAYKEPEVSGSGWSGGSSNVVWISVRVRPPWGEGAGLGPPSPTNSLCQYPPPFTCYSSKYYCQGNVLQR